MVPQFVLNLEENDVPIPIFGYLERFDDLANCPEIRFPSFSVIGRVGSQISFDSGDPAGNSSSRRLRVDVS